MKLLTLLQALDEDDYREFEKFLQSPFFKPGKNHLVFFRYLRRHHPAFDADKAALEAAYKRCFGKETYTDAKLYNLFSGMSRLVEDYLAVSAALSPNGASQGRTRRELLVTALGTRNAGAHFRAEAQHLADEIAANPTKETRDYLRLEQLHQQRYFHPDTPKFNAEAPDLEAVMEWLDLHWCLGKLRYAAEMKTRERLLKVSYVIPLLEEALEKTADPALQERHPLIAVYHQLVQLYDSGVNESGFRELKDFFLEKFALLPPLEQRYLLQHLINYGIFLIEQHCDVEPDLLALYKKAKDVNMLLISGRLTDGAFINIVFIAALCGEHDWADTFLLEFSPYLEEAKRHPAIALAKSFIQYCRGDLDAAQNHLIAIVFSTPPFDTRSRALLLKITFDRYVLHGKDYNFLLSNLKAFEKYVNNKELSEDKRFAFLNYIRFARRLAILKFDKIELKEAQKKRLHDKLKQLQPVVSKKWLAGKIEVL